MISVGLDLSLVGAGLAHIGGDCVLIGEEGITKLSLADRFVAVDRLAGRIIDQIGAWNPTAVMIEQLDMARSYGGTIERTVLWWLVVKEIDMAGIPVFTAASAQGKIYATGSSSATKSMVVDAVARTWPHFVTRGNDNLADAAVYCAMMTHYLAAPLKSMPKKNCRALNAVKSLHDVPIPKKAKPRKTISQATMLDT